MYFENLDLKEVVEEMLIFLGVKCWFSEKIVVDMIVVDDYVYYFVEIKVIIDGVC